MFRRRNTTYFVRQRRDYYMDLRPQYVVYTDPKPYGLLSFLGDVTMVIFTCGFWLIRIYVRENRRR